MILMIVGWVFWLLFWGMMSIWLYFFIAAIPKGRTFIRESAAFARALEGSAPEWREVWEGKLALEVFEERLRARCQAARETNPRNERWWYELLAMGVELVGMVPGMGSELSDRRRHHLNRVLSDL